MRALALLCLLAACAKPPAAPPPGETPPASRPAPAEAGARWERGVKADLDAALPDLRACHDRELRRFEDAALDGGYSDGGAPSLAGRVVLVLPVRPSGAVESPRVGEDTLGNAAIVECLLARVRTLRFAPVPGGEEVELELPVTFSVSGPRGR